MRHFTLRLLALLPGLLAAGIGHAATGAPPALLPCQIEHPLHLSSFPARCLELRVPENPREPGGRQITLHVAVLAALNRTRRPDPLFLIAGGPGLGTGAMYAQSAPAFGRIQLDRDIVLVDQRGTGASNPLNCALTEDELYSEDEAQLTAQSQRCLASLKPLADVTQYTTSVAVQDLEQVRRALGYGPIDLYAVSYGTRVAQHYLRRYPASVRAMVLDGVVPPAAALGASAALDAQHALEAIFARCAADSQCHGRFGDPAAAYREVRSALAARPAPVSLADPRSGEPVQFDFTVQHFATVLRLLVYAPAGAALLPLLLHDADQAHDFTALAAQFRMVSADFAGEFAIGMHNTVVCAEDVPRYDARHIDRAALAATFMGTRQIDGLITLCHGWPAGVVDADLHAPLRSDVPILLLSGSDDPVTPPAFGEEARAGFSRSLHVVLPGFGHGQLSVPCMPRVLQRFYERGAVAGLDVACTRAARPQAFFISRNGPGP